jgi:hypothetical protein
MTQLSPEQRFGRYHKSMIGMASDVGHSINTLPGMMVFMLREGGWRCFERDGDGKLFEHESVEAWILNPSYAGLNFPDWATLYAILECNLEDGPECLRLLLEAGAPDPATITADLAKRRLELVQKMRAHRRPKKGENKGVNHTFKKGTGNAAYTVARLKRDRPDLAERVVAGELSANAAAIEAGFRKKATPLEALRRSWSRATADERETFLQEVI